MQSRTCFSVSVPPKHFFAIKEGRLKFIAVEIGPRHIIPGDIIEITIEHETVSTSIVRTCTHVMPLITSKEDPTHIIYETHIESSPIELVYSLFISLRRSTREEFEHFQATNQKQNN